MQCNKTLAISLVLGFSVCAVNGVQAKGCNGVVSPAEWGCAAWDNNNGPQFPHYKKPAAAVAAPAAVPAPAVVQKAPVVVPNRNGNGIVAQGGGNIVAQGGGNIVAQGGGNIVAQGGGNFKK